MAIKVDKENLMLDNADLPLLIHVHASAIEQLSVGLSIWLNESRSSVEQTALRTDRYTMLALPRYRTIQHQIISTTRSQLGAGGSIEDKTSEIRHCKELCITFPASSANYSALNSPESI
jgi:hypothetical protein